MATAPIPPRRTFASAPRSAAAAEPEPKTGSALDEMAMPIAAPAAPHVESARGVIASYLKATRANQLYPRHSRVRKEHVAEFAGKLVAHVAAHGETEFRVRQTSITWGEDVIYSEEERQRSLAFRLFVNGVRRVVVSVGIEGPEAETFVEVLSRAFDKDAATDDLRNAVWEASFSHVQFSLSDELFSADEERAFADFVHTGASHAESAGFARDEIDADLDALEALPDPPGFADDECAAFRLTLDEQAELDADVKGETARDLLAEFSEYLLEELTGEGADAVHTLLAEFVDHVLSSGDVLRAARLLKSLRDLAGSTTDAERQEVLHEVIERIGKAQIVPKIRPLVPELIEGDRDALILLLTAVGEPAIAPLCDLLDTAAKDGAVSALRVLAPRHPKALLPFLLDARPIVVRNVMSMLAEAGSTEVISGFLPALRHADIGVRREAIRALAKFGGRHATDLFLTALEDTGYEVRALALGALAEGRDPRAVQPLLRRVAEASFGSLTNYEKRETFRTLARIGTPEAVTSLIRMLNTTSLLRRAKTDELRALAAAALGLIGSNAARHALTLHEKDRSEDVRRAVAGALKFPPPTAASGETKPPS